MRKKIVILVTLAAVMLISVSAVSAQGNGWQGGQRGNPMNGNRINAANAYVTTPPPQDIIDLMIAGWLDEQHAYAVYGSVLDQFGAVIPFTRIQQAEAQHSAAWARQFARYGLALPDVPNFDLPEFSSVSEACAVAAEAEIANFSLYDTMLDAFADYPNMYQVTQQLRNVSEFNHLPAFEACGY